MSSSRYDSVDLAHRIFMVKKPEFRTAEEHQLYRELVCIHWMLSSVLDVVMTAAGTNSDLLTIVDTGALLKAFNSKCLELSGVMFLLEGSLLPATLIDFL